MPLNDSPETAVVLLDRAFNEGNLDAVLSCYEAGAAIVSEPGKVLQGALEIKCFFEAALQSGAKAHQLHTSVIEANGIALFLSRWTLTPKEDGSAASPRAFIATSVLHRQADGTWKVLIDNPFGPLHLDAS
jgi:ketosteroid isomerase-like protein